jgi:hypothetical protein
MHLKFVVHLFRKKKKNKNKNLIGSYIDIIFKKP